MSCNLIGCSPINCHHFLFAAIISMKINVQPHAHPSVLFLWGLIPGVESPGHKVCVLLVSVAVASLISPGAVALSPQ